MTGPRWWWAAFALAIFGLIAAGYIYDSNLSLWLRRPDALATAIAISIAAVCVGAFIFMSARRASEIGSSPKALLTCLFILPIPFWIVVLGFLPTQSEKTPFPLTVFLRRLKFAVGITAAVGAVTLAAYYFLGNLEIAGNPVGSAKQNGTGAEQKIIPSFSECYKNGIAYFKEIDSYPRLSTGENVVDVVEERCQRSRLAFGY